MKKALTSKDLIIHLVESGYRYRKPKCRTWKLAFTLRHENSVLCILFRKNGIDLKLYEQYKNEISIDKNNQISMVGGKLFRNYYNESNNLITQKIKVISSCFIKGRIIDEIRIQDGRSYLLNEEYQNIREKSKDALDCSPLGEWVARRVIQRNLKDDKD